MLDQAMKEKITEMEAYWGYSLPKDYRIFLLTILKDQSSYEIYNKVEDAYIYLYNAFLVLERNTTYNIQKSEPNYFMIGQDGDRGYFVSGFANDDKVYGQDLGALGSLEMEIVSLNIRDFIKGDEYRD